MSVRQSFYFTFTLLSIYYKNILNLQFICFLSTTFYSILDSKLINSSSNTKLTTHSETNNINNTNQTHTENTEFDPMSQELLNTLISRLESVTTRLETIQFAPPNSLSNNE
jgi:hypothetical protein